MSYCDHSPSVVVVISMSVRPSTIFKQHLLLNHWLEFDQTTGMILSWSSFKVVQMVPVPCISRSQELKIDFLTKNLKNLLVRNHRTDFNIILQKCSFGDPLPRLFKPFGFVKKHGRQGRGLFSLYNHIEKFKNLLVRNHWTHFHIILQKCSFGDPLPRLFEPFEFVKKHGHQDGGLIFTIYLYRKL